MTVSINELQTWMNDQEGEQLEFKEAKTSFHFEKLVKYCIALANEGGGKMILGVTDKLPRKVVGSRAFSNFERTKAGLNEQLRLHSTKSGTPRLLGGIRGNRPFRIMPEKFNWDKKHNFGIIQVEAAL